MGRRDLRLGLYLMNAKGAAVLEALLEAVGPAGVAYVVSSRNAAVEDDGFESIEGQARTAGIRFLVRGRTPPRGASHLIAAGWRWLIKTPPGVPLFVFHDSLLPRYRGFLPLVSMLVNGERRIGVTALAATEVFDRGPILAQCSTAIRYPITIAEAIQQIIPCYKWLAVRTSRRLLTGQVSTVPQNEARASYSLWRDDRDYLMNWGWDAARLRRFVDAVGPPYKGAAVWVGDRLFRVRSCEAIHDVRVENRDPGKVLFSDEGKPIVVCGRGLLKILRLTDGRTGADALPLDKFRVRFGEKP